MVNDRETAPNYVNLWISTNKKFLDECKKAYLEEVSEEESKEDPRIVISSNDSFELQPGELYFNEDDKTIVCNFEMEHKEGTVLGSIVIPLSDLLLIDILQHTIKKLNKLKTVLETLK